MTEDPEPDLIVAVWADETRRFGAVRISTDMPQADVVTALRRTADAIENEGPELTQSLN